VQGQDARGVRLAVRARTRGLTAADVDRALTDDRSLLITWVNRFTLHLIRSEDYPLLHALTAPPLFTAVNRRLAQEGVESHGAERAVATIVAALADGPRTRAELRDRVNAAGVPTDGQAMVHLLALASLRGHIVRGPMRGRQHAYVLVEDWLGPRRPPPERSRALAELARRYLRGHGPADARDLAKWAGLPLRDARAAFAAIAPALRQRQDGLVELAAIRRSRARLPGPRLLGAFDPVLLGWRAREFVVGEYGPSIMVGGMFRPFVLVDGRAAGVWKLERGEVVAHPFEGAFDVDTAAALAAEGRAVRAFLGL
jgi:hypothetical protein